MKCVVLATTGVDSAIMHYTAVVADEGLLHVLRQHLLRCDWC
jgi:hypothetical protein